MSTIKNTRGQPPETRPSESTSKLLSEIIAGNISDANLRMLLKAVKVYNDEDGGIDVALEFNGEFNS